MPKTTADLAAHLLDRIAEVRCNLGYEAEGPATMDARFADLLDSMGMVEFLGIVADDCGVSPTAIEECTERRFGTIAELAEAMGQAGLVAEFGTARTGHERAAPRGAAQRVTGASWLAGVTVRLPVVVQPAADLDALLHQPTGWLEKHAGIRSRRIWGHEDPIQAGVASCRVCMEKCRVLPGEIGALLVTSEAPPRL